jgi:phosphopantothenoylcysteine decarboxylase/phosphopantothenate--cysteine ligase
MGIALARMAQIRGADVTLVLGPTEVQPPRTLSEGPGRVRVVRVVRALDMLEATQAAVADADALLMAAAVADERPAHTTARKLHKDELTRSLALESNPDILMTLRPGLEGRLVLGFAAETEAVEESGRRKLEAKRLDLLFANPVGADRGFGSSLSEGVLLAADGSRREIHSMTKEDLADELLDAVSVRMPTTKKGEG